MYHQNTLKIFSSQYVGMFAVYVYMQLSVVLKIHGTLGLMNRQLHSCTGS